MQKMKHVLFSRTLCVSSAVSWWFCIQKNAFVSHSRCISFLRAGLWHFWDCCRVALLLLMAVQFFFVVESSHPFPQKTCGSWCQLMETHNPNNGRSRADHMSHPSTYKRSIKETAIANFLTLKASPQKFERLVWGTQANRWVEDMLHYHNAGKNLVYWIFQRRVYIYYIYTYI